MLIPRKISAEDLERYFESRINAMEAMGFRRKDMKLIMTDDFFYYVISKIAKGYEIRITPGADLDSCYLFDVPVEFSGHGIRENNRVTLMGKVSEQKSYVKPNKFEKKKNDIVDGTTNLPTVKRVVNNDPATIVFWTDGTKTVVKAHGEPYDAEKGFAMAFLKKCWGNNSSYNDKLRECLSCPKTDRLQKAVEFLRKNNLLNMQYFFDRNWIGDVMENIYNADGIQIDVCHGYGYIEILGLTMEEEKNYMKLSEYGGWGIKKCQQ